MTNEPIDHERILKITRILKGFDLKEKQTALGILSNVLTVFVEITPKRTIAVTQQEADDEPGFTVAINGPGLQIFIPRDAINPDRETTKN
jgi:hypothetical protein